MNPAVLSNQSNFLVTFLASFLIWVIYFFLFFLFVFKKINWKVFIISVLSSLISWSIVYLIKNLFNFERPFEINNLPTHTFTIPGTNDSFPSAHSALSFGLAISLWFQNRKIGFWFIVLACFVGVGRIASNVHYYTDIVGGVLIAFVISYLVVKVAPKLIKDISKNT